MNKLRQRIRIFFKKAKRTEEGLEEQVWVIEHASPIGFRTIKTAISIFLCLVVYMLIEQFGFTDTSNAFLACVTAIICMKDSVDESLHTGLFRLVGTFIGAVSGMAYIYLARMLDEAMSDMILLSLFIIVVISLCNLFKSPDAIVICCVVFLFVAMNQTDPEIGPVVHSIQRFTDTVIGLAVSFLVNRFLFNPAKKPAELIDEENIDEQSAKKKSTE
ncbi:MAG: aromatic acid exporter family protein [Bacillota bacterium]|nr:aromatic acid exporter family protein [Bacillota bacterium]